MRQQLNSRNLSRKATNRVACSTLVRSARCVNYEFTSDNSGPSPALRRWQLLLCCLVTIALVTAPLPTALFAQDEPAEAAVELQREVRRTAPQRQPRYRQQTQLTNAVRTVVELPAVADSYIASARPNQNFGADSLYMGYNMLGDAFGAERLLIRFDVANAIPANATINSAQLRLRLAFASPTDDAEMGTVLRRLASHWNEATVTWNSEPSWTDVDERTSIGSELTWYEWEVGREVAEWVAGTPNHGLEIIGDERQQQRERAFYSRETQTEYFPRLLVDYTVIDDDRPPQSTIAPLPTFVGRNFLVTWDGEDPGEAGIAHYDVQYRVDGGDWISWLSAVTTTRDEFPSGQNGRTYEFRVRATDEAGNTEAFGAAEAMTTVDTLPPDSIIFPLPATTDNRNITVQWSGTDEGAGIEYYDVRYRINDGAWQLWQSQTTQTSALFSAPADGFYAFEVRAVDRRGNVEEFAMVEESITVDAQPPFLDERLYLPLVSR